MSNLESLIDARFNEDDITILLLKRTAASPAVANTSMSIGILDNTR
jgi:hypothetical protein